MRINIFGVGRSGTTALLLYFSYLHAKNCKSLWLINEPFHWHTRKGPISMRGQESFLNSGIILNKNESLNLNASRFISDIFSRKENYVCKYVAGSGFSNQINEISSPDYSVTIVRNLYDVLKSISGERWSFMTIHSPSLFGTKSGWGIFKRELRSRKLLKKYDLNLKDYNTNQELNALYWFLTNDHLLEFTDPNNFILPFEQLEKYAPIIGSKIFSIDINKFPPINSPMFFDNNLSRNYPLKSDFSIYEKSKYSNVINEIIYFIRNEMCIPIPYTRLVTGSLVKESDKIGELLRYKSSKSSLKPNVQKSKKLDLLCNIIDSKLRSRLVNQGFN